MGEHGLLRGKRLFRLLPVLLLTSILIGCTIPGFQDQSRHTAVMAEDHIIEWAFTQDGDHPELQLIAAIDAAQHQVDIAIYSLTHPDIVQAIKQAHQRGVSVRLITDKSQLSGQSQTEAAKILGSAGVSMKVNRHSGLMHLKLTIVDQTMVSIGSFNYSKAASTRNDEVLMFLYDREVAQSFEQHFESLWNNVDRFETLHLKIAQAESSKSSDPTNESAKSGVTTSSQTGQHGSVPSSTPGQSCVIPTIKGNITSKGEKIYHLPEGQYYEVTIAEEMFCSVEEAENQGYRVSSR